MIKECAEEANIPKTLITLARPVGSISYVTEREEGLRDDTLFCFDIELPSNFKPINIDGEVDDFFLWPLKKISHIVETTKDFKFNSALVVIDFLIRHSYILPSQKNYTKIVNGLNKKTYS